MELALDPLIAEAKRRTRQRRFTLLAIVVAAALVAGGFLVFRGQSGAMSVPHRFGSDPAPAGDKWVNGFGASGGVLWAMDRHGFVWLTPASGEQWQYALHRSSKVHGPGIVENLNDVQFVDRQHGWASVCLRCNGAGGEYQRNPRPWALERTVDGGKTWSVLWLPGCGCSGGEMSFYDARHGYVLANEKAAPYGQRLFWTDDGGKSWTLVARPALDGSITFVDRLHGFLRRPPTTTGCGIAAPGRNCQETRTPGALYRTTDGGKTWTRMATPPPSMSYFPVSAFGRSLVVADAKGGRTLVYTSADGGAHWKASATPLSAKAQSDFSAASPTKWAFSVGVTLYVTNDGGGHWQRIVAHGLAGFRRGQPYLSSLILSTSGLMWGMSGDKALYRSNDGGRHWKPAGLR